MSALKPRRLDFKMTDEEYASLKKAIAEGNIADFTRAFNEKHNTKGGDIITLATMKAMETKDILSLAAVYEAAPFDLEIITTENTEGKNLILYALENGFCRLISKPMYGLKDHTKYEFDEKLIEEIADWIKKTPSLDSINPADLIDELLKPVLTEEQSEAVIKIIGLDWLDSYYV